MKSASVILQWYTVLCLLFGTLSTYASLTPDELDAFGSLNVTSIDPGTYEDILCHTNAECLKRGLPLLRPTKRQHLVPRAGPSARPYIGAVVVWPSGTGPHRRSFRSKRSLVRRANEAPTGSLGFLSVTYNGFGYFSDLTQDYDSALQINYDSMDLDYQNVMTNHAGGKPYFCAGGGAANQNGRDTLSTGSANYAWLTSCTNPGTPDTASNTASNPADAPINVVNTQAAIWKVDPTHGKITVLWTNPDDTSPQNLEPTVAYDSENGLHLTGNMAMFDQRFGATSQAVDLYAFSS